MSLYPCLDWLIVGLDLFCLELIVLGFGVLFQREMPSMVKIHDSACEDDHHGDCAICFNKIVLQETALVKGCEHAYWFVLTKSHSSTYFLSNLYLTEYVYIYN